MNTGSLAAELVDLFLPRGCVACGERIPPEEDQELVCAMCRLRLRPLPPPFCPRCQFPQGTGRVPGEVCLECQDWRVALRSARAAVLLDGVAGAIVHALKYRGWGELAELMAGRMALDVPRDLSDPILVPVPTTSWRRRTRGYNQAALLARAMSSISAIPVVEALRRSGGRTQVSLGPRERRWNVQGVFTLEEGSRSLIEGREVIVIDDVLTTGATANAAALALESGQPASVRLLAFARSLPFAETGRG